MKPEPTTDVELTPAMMNGPEPTIRTEPTIALEPKPHCESDQVCEPATTCVIMGLLMEFEGMEENPAHHPMAESELRMDSGI